MKRVAVAVALIGMLSAAACTATGQLDQAAFRAAMDKGLKEYCASCMSGDVARYMSQWDAQGVQYPPEAPMVAGKAAIAQGMEGVFAAIRFTRFAVKLVETRQLTPTIGYATLTYSYEAVPKAGGATIPFEGKDLSVWKKQADGSWKLLHDVFNSNAAAPSNADPSLVGSWVNQTTKEAYNYVYYADGRVDGYGSEGTASPWEAAYAIEKRVPNADGSTTFFLKETWSGVRWYVLWKVAKDGKTAEHNASGAAYLPFDQVPLGTGFHCIYARK